jgi:acyl-coenzyme A thioesterase PaaI-like protein
VLVSGGPAGGYLPTATSLPDNRGRGAADGGRPRPGGYASRIMNHASSPPPSLAMTISELQDMLDGSFPGVTLPYTVDGLTPTTARLRQHVGVSHSRPGGTVSGPALMALADCAAWAVILGRIGPVALSVTTSLHIDFLRKPDLVDLVAEATLLKLGKVWIVDPLDGNDEMVAKAQVTYSIPPR